MTLREELSDIYGKAKSMYGGLMAMGCKASVLYKLEKVMELCQGDGDPTPDRVAEVKDMMWSISLEDGGIPN